MKPTIRAALLAAPLVTLCAAARAADVGVVAVAQSDVRLTAPGQPKARKVGAMQGLPENSRLQIGANGRAVVVLYKDGSRFALPAGCLATISSDGVKVENGVELKKLSSLKLQQTKILRSSRVAFGRPANVRVRGAKEVQLESLLFGATQSTRPVFKWAAVPGAVSYRVSVEDDNGKTVLDRESTTTSLTFPTDVPELKSGVLYLWKVSTRVGDDTFEKDGSFEILSPEKRTELQAELDSLSAETDEDSAVLNDYLKAEIYRRYDLLDDAAVVYKQLLEKNPESADLHESFSQLLRQQNLRDESEFHRLEAEKLSANGMALTGQP